MKRVKPTCRLHNFFFTVFPALEMPFVSAPSVFRVSTGAFISVFIVFITLGRGAAAAVVGAAAILLVVVVAIVVVVVLILVVVDNVVVTTAVALAVIAIVDSDSAKPAYIFGFYNFPTLELSFVSAP